MNTINSLSSSQSPPSGICPNFGYKLSQEMTLNMQLSRLSSSGRSHQEHFSSQKTETCTSDQLTQQHLHHSSSSSSMTTWSHLLSSLVLLSLFSSSFCTPMCNNQCCRFVEGFPVRLKKLREDYSQIRDFYEANDDLDIALLDQSVEDSFKSSFACHAMNSILDFYLTTVLPSAMAGVSEDNRDLQPHVESIQQIFDELKSDVIKCRHYFSCRKQFDINNLNSTYTQMESKGLYKAMGELDLLFNYIETYLASKRHRNLVATV
ncbi:interleukin-10 [Anoplopoma fimbria]|uniref:interleukin-10 n=1 Tax=Anoplopoma fimbria TaxID=229290 RepID=UPI0023EAEAB5|nr:interleukin-10 [Anoplopoma fimbria]